MSQIFQGERLDADEISQIFTKLHPQDVEQFYTGYQLWTAQQQIAQLQAQIATIHQRIAANAVCLQQVSPSAIALATVAQLQSHGVTDVELLDRMLERGEEWLDRTIQHLAYCEQLHVIREDYTQWCVHALEDAYDWIDSMPAARTLSSQFETRAPEGSRTSDEQPLLREATEDLFLQKLMREDAEVASPVETTLKIATLVHSKPEETAPAAEEVPPITSEQSEETPSEMEEMHLHAPRQKEASYVTRYEANEPVFHEVRPRRRKRNYLLRLLAIVFHKS